jgi:hypothetical protein
MTLVRPPPYSECLEIAYLAAVISVSMLTALQPVRAVVRYLE